MYHCIIFVYIERNILFGDIMKMFIEAGLESSRSCPGYLRLFEYLLAEPSTRISRQTEGDEAIIVSAETVMAYPRTLPTLHAALSLRPAEVPERAHHFWVINSQVMMGTRKEYIPLSFLA